MRTQTLIDGLSRDLEPVRARAPRGRLLAALAVGGGLAAGLLTVWLGLRPDLLQAVAGSVYWLKTVFTVAVALSAIMLVLRAGRPGARLVGVAPWIVLPFVLALGLTAVELLSADGADRYDLWLGQSWRLCSLRIALLSVPVTAGALWALRSAAPTRPALAGAAAGLLGGAVAASIYGLHCPESTAAFTATWYSLGMLAPAALGAVIGRIFLRW